MSGKSETKDSVACPRAGSCEFREGFMLFISCCFNDFCNSEAFTVAAFYAYLRGSRLERLGIGLWRQTA